MKKTIIDLFDETVNHYSETPFLYERGEKVFQSITYKQTHDLVYRLGGGIMSLGLQKGERMSLLMEACNNWIIGEMAILYAGGINVPISVKLVEATDLMFRLNHSEARFVLTSHTQLEKIRAIRDRLETVEKVIVLGAKPEDLQEDEMTFDELYAMGDRYNIANPGAIQAMSLSVQNDDLANISYTSGTTADPKGVMLTHRNFTANVEQSLSVVAIPEFARTLIILPLDHCFAHVTALYTFMAQGGSIATVPVGKNFIESIKNIPRSMNEFQPEIIMTVPALVKTFRNNVEKNVREKGKLSVLIFNLAMKLTIAYNKDGYNKGTKGTWILKPLVTLFNDKLFSRMRAAMGGKLKIFVDGGAYLDIDMQKFWYAAGIPILQGYGLSEATPVISCNKIDFHKLGTSGQIVKGLEVTIRDEKDNILRIGQKGEIVVKGENVMAGYWKNPEATAATVKDGWLHTGDLGCMDEMGFLYVFGRSKSLLIGNDGEKYSPEGIEESITTLSPYINQIMLYNNQNHYTVALIYPDMDTLKRTIHNFDTPEGKKEAIRLILQSINQFRKGGKYESMFPERWLPSAFALLSEGFNENNQLMNSTMKIMRSRIEKKYESKLQYMFTPEGKKPYNEENFKALN
ncbi:MAG: AMP-binding protein [Bacteroidales bacterium]